MHGLGYVCINKWCGVKGADLQSMKDVHVGVEDPVFAFTRVLESFISCLLMSGPVDRMPVRV